MSGRFPVSPALSRGRVIVTAALVAFVAANVIHNQFSLDPAPAPAALLTGLSWWKPWRALVVGAALVIAFPAFSFLKWDALAHESGTAAFWNHVLLLLAGVFAIAGGVFGLMPKRRQG
ncbi:MAG: hypothetical protein L0Z51_02545 [Candidatus Latescibacteria bacterium]|nr:hypothetical protein [Candidatus Latescibacterota bacterium]